jgi:hypothetical protein
MATNNNISTDLADLLATHNFDAEMSNARNNSASAEDATVFKFDFVTQTGRNYGTAVIVIGDNSELMLFYGDNLGRGMEPEDKDQWFAFMKELKDFSIRHNFYNFSPKNLNSLKRTMQGMAAIKEGLFEGYYGTRKVSYMGEQTDARLVINHNRPLGEADKRYCYVESLFIETADQERFRLPFKSLAGGRAMLEHVRQGGRPYDVRGNHITEIVSEMAVLSRFNRAQQRRVFEGVTQELVENAQQYYYNLQETVKQLGGSRGYQVYFESWAPDQTGEAESLVENLRNLFVEQTLDARIEAALPTLAKIQQQGTKMKEAQIFENWINTLSEGTWALPETPEQQEKLNQLMSAELIVGPDATNAKELLGDIVGDDKLFDILNDLADNDPRANIWDDSDVQRRLAELGVQTPQSTAAEPADVAQDTAPEIKEQGMAEGYQLDEGAVETITALVKKIPGIGKYYQMAQQYKPQLIEILKTSKSGKEVKQKMEQLAAGQSATVAESGMMKQLGGLAVGGGSILSTMWMNAMGMIDGVLAHAAAGEVGGAVASGSILGLIPVTLMLFAAMLMFKGSKQSSDEKAQAFQAQRGQQGMAEGDNMATFEQDRELAEMLKYAGVPIKEGVLTDSTGSTLDHIQNTFKRDVKDFAQSGEMSDALYDVLYDYYFDDMPYGTKKARTGDPHEWVSNRFAQDIGIDEGVLGTVGGAALGSMLGGPIGAAVGATGGQELTKGGSSIIEGSCNMTMEGSYCPEHGLAKCEGMYEDGGAVGMPYSMGENNEIVRNAKKLTDGWKGTLAGSAAGGLAGSAAGEALGPAAGAALGGAVGGLPGALAGAASGAAAGGAIGGAAGGLAGGKIGDKLGGPEETDEGSNTANIVKGAAKAATQGLADMSGSGKEIAKNLVYMEDDPINSNSAMTGSYYEGKETDVQAGDALLARIKSLALLR